MVKADFGMVPGQGTRIDVAVFSCETCPTVQYSLPDIRPNTAWGRVSVYTQNSHLPLLIFELSSLSKEPLVHASASTPVERAAKVWRVRH